METKGETLYRFILTPSYISAGTSADIIVEISDKETLITINGKKYLRSDVINLMYFLEQHLESRESVSEKNPSSGERT